jgi:hypothetical protein
VPSLRTEITELATGLGMLGYDSPERALVRCPAEFHDVDGATWQRLVGAADESKYRIDFLGAFLNGRAFFESSDGLRGRRPLLVEWKGGHRAVSADAVPVDLRVDHVFLVSCKYASRILLNSAPAVLFDGGADVGDWYTEVAPDQHQALYATVRSQLPDVELPPFVADLARHHRRGLKEVLGGIDWGVQCHEAYAELSAEVGRASAARWRSSVHTKRQREGQLWRLLRIGSAPYYVLGSAPDRALRLRVTTPWDWRRRFEFKDLEVWGESAGQPRVAWRGTVRDNELGADQVVDGHVEVRWSHGRFAQSPEAKVYLDTPHDEVPGYLPLS